MLPVIARDEATVTLVVLQLLARCGLMCVLLCWSVSAQNSVQAMNVAWFNMFGSSPKAVVYPLVVLNLMLPLVFDGAIQAMWLTFMVVVRGNGIVSTCRWYVVFLLVWSFASSALGMVFDLQIGLCSLSVVMFYPRNLETFATRLPMQFDVSVLYSLWHVLLLRSMQQASLLASSGSMPTLNLGCVHQFFADELGRAVCGTVALLLTKWRLLSCCSPCKACSCCVLFEHKWQNPSRWK